MHVPFTSKTKTQAMRDQLENRLDDLAAQTEGLRQQVADRAPAVRDHLIDMLPDKHQLRDLRDDLIDHLPDNVQDKLPENVKPQRSRFKRVAVVGLIVGAGAAAFAVVRDRAKTPTAPEPFAQPRPATASAGSDTAEPVTQPSGTQTPDPI